MVTPLPRSRKAAAVCLLALMITASVAGVAYYRGGEEVRLGFGGKEGLSTQSGHGTSLPESLLEIVQRTADEYVTSLEVLRPFTVFDTTIHTPLLNVTVHADAQGLNQTYIETGYANITIDGLLSTVPSGDVDELVTNLTEQGYALADGLLEEEEPSPSPSPSPSPTSGPDPLPIAEGPFYLEYIDNGSRVLVISVAPLAERVDVIVLEGPHFGGLHVTTTPFVVSHHSGNGTLLDLVVRNPVEATVGDLHYPVEIREVTCSEGECIPEAARDLRFVCTETDACPNIPRTHLTNVTHDGGPVALPGELLHVWSSDAVHGGAGISILGNESVNLTGHGWTGDPFGGDLTLIGPDGTPVASLGLDLPSPTEPQLGFRIDGPLVRTLAGDALAHHEDLDTYRVQVDWGPLHLSNSAVYEAFDTLNGLLSGTWSDSDGTIRAAHLTTLVDGGDLLTLVEDTEGDIQATIAPLNAELVYQAGRIEAQGGGLLAYAQGLPDPARRAAFDIVNVTTGEAEYQISVVEGAVGCGITTLGCLGLVLGPAGDLLEENGLPRPPSDVPDPQAILDGAPVDSDEIIAYVNTLSGTIIGYLPGGDAPIPCLDSTTPLTCLLTASPTEVAGAAVGFLGGAAPALSLVADEENETVGVYDAQGEPVAAYASGTIHVAGHLAQLGEDPLLTVSTPTGETLCVRHTFDADQMMAGAWPSLEVGCDGIGGSDMVLQPGARYALDPQGNLQEIAIHHPADPHDPLFYYYDDGETTTILAHPTAGADPVVIPSRHVQVAGNPATSSTYRIDIADTGRSGDGILRGIAVVRDAWLASERVGRGLVPDTYASVVFDVTHGPQVDPWVSDGRTTLTAGHGALEGQRWLSGLEPQSWLLETDDPSAQLDLLYRVGDLPRVDGDRAPFNVIGFNRTTSDTIYQAELPASALAPFQTGGTMHFALAWTTRQGPIAVTVIDDNGGAAYRYRFDTDLPTASVGVQATSEDSTFPVRWSGANERGSGLSTFHVESNDGTGWQPWIGGRHVTEPLEARFTGQPDTTYSFRAKACDVTLNCGPWSGTESITVAGAAAPPPTAGPVLTVLAPQEGATVKDFVALAWTVDHDAATDPMVTVDVRPTNEAGWTAVYSGHRTSATWDTNALWDGHYEIRYTASDGTRSDTETRQVQVDNDRPAPTIDIGSGQGTSGATPQVDGPAGQTEKKKDTPAAGLPLVLLGLFGLLAVAGRRRR